MRYFLMRKICEAYDFSRSHEQQKIKELVGCEFKIIAVDGNRNQKVMLLTETQLDAWFEILCCKKKNKKKVLAEIKNNPDLSM